MHEDKTHQSFSLVEFLTHELSASNARTRQLINEATLVRLLGFDFMAKMTGTVMFAQALIMNIVGWKAFLPDEAFQRISVDAQASPSQETAAFMYLIAAAFFYAASTLPDIEISQRAINHTKVLFQRAKNSLLGSHSENIS